MGNNENIRVSCSDCGAKLPAAWAHSKNEEKCPECGSIKQSIEIEFEDHIEMHDKLQGKVKDQNYSSKQNPRYEFIEGDDQRKSDGKWMKKTRVIDKYNDKYIERVTDLETGEVVHEKKEPLSNHFGHGTAKFKKDKNA